MEFTQRVFDQDVTELDTNEEDFKEETIKDVENEVFITFSYQKNNEESQYHSRKGKNGVRPPKRKLDEHENEREYRNQEDDHYLGKNSENINRYTSLCWEDYICKQRQFSLRKSKFLYHARVSFYEYWSPIFQHTDDFIATSVRHGTYNIFQRCI